VAYIPPKAFFPAGDKHRKNLIRVPSCDAHNGDFSPRDAVVGGIVGMLRESSALGVHHFETGAYRAFDKDKQLAKRMMPEITVHQFKHVGLEVPTFNVDLDVFQPVMERIAKALHFYTWRTRWPGALQVKCEQFRNDDLSPAWPEMFRHLKVMFFQERELGDNSRVFHYQWHDGFIDSKGRELRIVAMRFFDGLLCTRGARSRNSDLRPPWSHDPTHP
jgi:hypothetical protein